MRAENRSFGPQGKISYCSSGFTCSMSSPASLTKAASERRFPKASTLAENVAVKSNIWRRFDVFDAISSTSCSKSIANNLSHSSKTKIFNYCKLKPFVDFKWSKTRPGVPTITWGFYANYNYYFDISTPPTKHATLRP